MRTLKFKSRLYNCVFRCRPIIITITSNEPGSTETHKTDRNPTITNHKPRPFQPVKVKFCFLRGLLRWLTAAKNAIVSWLLNFRIHMFVKSAVKPGKLWVSSFDLGIIIWFFALGADTLSAYLLKILQLTSRKGAYSSSWETAECGKHKL